MEQVLLSIIPYIIIAGGLFSIVCSLKEYRFFVEHRKAKVMAGLLGKTGMKVFYVTLGLGLVVAGLCFAIFGFPPEKPS